MNIVMQRRGNVEYDLRILKVSHMPTASTVTSKSTEDFPCVRKPGCQLKINSRILTSVPYLLHSG